MEVSGELHVPAALPSRKEPPYPLNRRQQGLRGGCYVLPLQGLEPPFLCYPACSQATTKYSNPISIIIIFGIFYMQGIYTYIPETNHVPRELRVAAILVLLLMVLISLVIIIIIIIIIHYHLYAWCLRLYT